MSALHKLTYIITNVNDVNFLFAMTELLPAGETATVVMGIDFCDSTQAANFQLW